MASVVLLLAGMALALILAWRRLAIPRRFRLSAWAAPAAFVAAAIFAAENRGIVEKFATALALPAGLLWLGGFAAVWWAAATSRGKLAIGLGLGWLVFSAAGCPLVADALMAQRERGLSPPAATARYDAVIVLGGGTGVTPWGTAQLSSAGDRLLVGARLFHAGQTPILIPTGSSIAGLSGKKTRDIASDAAALLGDMGVPRTAIVEIGGPTNTHDEMIAIAKLARSRGWRRLGLVTSGFHLPRALRLARSQGLAPDPIPADLRFVSRPLSLASIPPTGDGFYAVQIAAKEVLAGLIGR